MDKKPLNIYWLNPPLSTRTIYSDTAWMSFNTCLPNHNWIQPIIDWDEYKTIEDILLDFNKQPVDVLMISNYTWNHKLCAEVSRIVKTRHPEIIIISGGPQQLSVPDYVDYSCYAMGHGEIFLTELFKQLEKHGRVIFPDAVPYLITKNFKSSITKGKYEFKESSIKNNLVYILEASGVAKRLSKSLTVYYETTRGCPYSCAYCEWGAGGTAAKISQKPIEMIFEELEIIACYGINSIDIIDANFGILKRDIQIVKKVSELKKTYGFPQRLSLYGLTKNSKNNKEIILDELHKSELFQFFMAIQSTDKNILENIKRFDIPLQENLELAEKYNRLYGVPAKVELILGLPGETLDNFYKEMDIIQKVGDWRDPRNIFSLLPQTEAYTQEYREKFKIKTAIVGSTENEEQDITYISDSVINQYKSSFEIVVETMSYTKEDYKEMFFVNRAQKVIGPTLTGKASIELRAWFNRVKYEGWYKRIDDHLTKLVNGELEGKEITVIDNKTIEEIVFENVKPLAS